MPVAAGPQAYHSQIHIPSFMSVYNTCNNVSTIEDHPLSESPLHSEVVALTDSPREASVNPTAHLKHKHRDSTSTQASESSDSSPTTTISTADSSALTDPSPSSSPESPVNILPLSSFASTGFGIHSLDDLTMSDHPIVHDAFDRPLTSPSPRKARNAKGLALNLGFHDSSLQASAPASPVAFVKPPLPKPRRKPSNLSLQTTSNFGAINTITLPPLALEPPPTPGPRRTMLHHAASTSQLGMFSPDPRGAPGPRGGMRLPGFERSQISGLSNAFRKPAPIPESATAGPEDKTEEEAAPIRTQLATRSSADIGGDAFDCAANEDVKSPGYPHGPIAIYEPSVYLYLEPTVEEASNFDVVMNVASEVKNPFKANPAPEVRETTISVPLSAFDSMDIDRDDIPEPMTAASMATFTTAFEVQPASATPTDASPTTPKPLSMPEYIHIPWEHNSDITKDLMSLCETIDDRVNKGKKVLIHCQQGASRSASLIIAYGLYRNPSLTVDAAYNAAQAKSKYVSPNINLMYALQDFRKTLQFRISKLGRSPKHRMTLSVDDVVDYTQKEPPQTAPLPSEPSGRGTGPPMALPHARGNSTPNLRDIPAGPSSAPSSYPWPSANERTPNTDLWTNPPPKPSPRGTFDFLQPLKFSPVEFSPPSSSFIPIDTPPNSQPASPPPAARGFSAHRDEHAAKRKPAPSLTFKPIHPLRPAPSLPALSAAPRAQFAAFPLSNAPASPGLWSPRIQEMAGPSLANTFSFHPPAAAAAVVDADADVVPPTPGIMSPRVANAHTNPFANIFAMDHHAAGLQQPDEAVARKKKSFVFDRADIARAMEKPLPPLPRVVDPRSPAMMGESVIVRSIDEVL